MAGPMPVLDQSDTLFKISLVRLIFPIPQTAHLPFHQHQIYTQHFQTALKRYKIKFTANIVKGPYDLFPAKYVLSVRAEHRYRFYTSSRHRCNPLYKDPKPNSTELKY